ncbi:MAG: OmpA family protein [Prochlorothrix sp.]|nr:OmpA family protein [Prochlorothrix sp.]
MAPAPSRVTATPAALESASLELQRLFATLDPAGTTAASAAPSTVAGSAVAGSAVAGSAVAGSAVAGSAVTGPVLPFSGGVSGGVSGEADRSPARAGAGTAVQGLTEPAARGGAGVAKAGGAMGARGARVEKSGDRPGFGQFLRTCGLHGVGLTVTLVCGLGAIGGGVALAEFGLAQRPLQALNLSAWAVPGAATEVPLLERGLRQVQRFQRSAGQWVGGGPGALPAEDLALAPADRQTVEQELARLQQESHQILDQVVALEQQLGLDPQGGSLDLRLERLQDLLNPSPGPVDPLVRMTLPSDALFGDSEAQLRPDAYRLLGPVIVDLRRYPGAQVTIAAHTDDIGATQTNLTLSLRQSRTLAQYLENHLGSQYRWNTLGYGESQPLVDNSTNSNRQRNRRLEIQITP